MPYSWSKLQKFLTCPRAYELSYHENLERILGVEGRARMLGSAFHAAIATFLELDDLSSAIRRGIGYIEDNTEQNKTYYDYEVGEYKDDTQYYLMIEDLRHLLPKLLQYHLPRIGIGTRYRVAKAGEVFAGQMCHSLELVHPETPMIEFEIDTDQWHGFVDAVLVDLETGEFVAVDWKLRSSFPFDALAAIDGQLPFYAAILNSMGANISKVIMWQFKNAPPKPAKINKNGQPSTAVQATTWDHWVATLPPNINASQYEETVRPKLKDDADFQNPVESVVTEFSSELALNEALHTTYMIREAEAYVGDGQGVMPARLSSMGCGFCDFWRLCSAPLKYGGDASDIIATEFKQKGT